MAHLLYFLMGRVGRQSTMEFIRHVRAYTCCLLDGPLTARRRLLK